ncbi:MAG: hypothetical protein FWB78_06205 [Treponema sp.]|nr:hypothetical protein [Treponema sp.]
MPTKTGFRLFAIGLFLAGFFAALPVHAGGGREIITHQAEGTDIWQTEFDVRNLPPGTWNIIINATDSAGNVGVSGPFNLRIDPMAGLAGTRIVYPAQGQIVRGEVNIVGVTNAPFGVRQIYASINDDYFFPVYGQEFWHINIPAGELPDGRHTISAKVSDLDHLEGAVSSIDFIVDTAPPSVEVTSHEIGDFISGRVRIRGTVDDANGIRSLSLSRDGQNFSPISHSGRRRETSRDFSFGINTRNYDDGPILYFLRAVDNTGYVTVEPIMFFVNNVPPVLEILSPTIGEDVFGLTQVSGRVVSLAGLDEFFYEWAGERVDIPFLPGDPFWAVNVPVDGRGGNFRITAIDRTGNVTRQTMQLRDRRSHRAPIIVIDYPVSAGRTMILAYDQPIYGHIAPGFFPFAVRLESGWLGANGEIRMAQPGFRIEPHIIPQGRSTLVLRAIDEDGLEGPAFSLRVQKGLPEEGFSMPANSRIRIESPAGYWGNGQRAQPWTGNTITVAGFVEGWTAGQTVQYRLGPDDQWRNVPVNDGTTEVEDYGETVARRPGSFDVTIALPAGLEGHIFLEFRTVRQGRGDFPVFLPVNRTAQGPGISFISPNVEKGSIHGMVTTAGSVYSLAPLVEMSYSVDGGYEFMPLDFTVRAGVARFNLVANYSGLYHGGLNLIVRAVDRAGNVEDSSPAFVFDDSEDLPVLILNSPIPYELVTRDFEISGLAYDDDGVEAIYWRILQPLTPWETVDQILARSPGAFETFDVTEAYEGEDEGETEYERLLPNGFAGFNRVDTTQNFLIEVGLDQTEDGLNVLEIFARDIFGTAGEITRRIIRASHSAPETVVTEPGMETWNSGNVMVRGTSFDLNNIASVFVSMDNGISWQRASVEGSHEEPSEWEINLNTRAFADGTYAMLIRAVDGFGVFSYSSGIINIDNTAPEVDVAFPREGASFATEIYVTGQIFDNMALRDISIRVVNIDDPDIQETRELDPRFVVMERFDVSAFPDGDYIVQLSARDYSGNETIVIRNVSLIRGETASEVAIINPLPGIAHSGPVVVSGRVSGALVPATVMLTMNEALSVVVDVDRFGVFRHEVLDSWFGNSPYYVFQASFQGPNGEMIESVEHAVVVNEYGPVLLIDSHRDGDAITGRPWLSGQAFILHPESYDEPLSRQERAELRPHSVTVSFDNGRTFVPASGRENWRIRLETDELPAGLLPIVVRAVFNDGRDAVRRILLSVDTMAPVVATIGPAENTFHRHDIMVFGSATDDSTLDSVEISLRQGSKHLYAVPGFVEGLYLEASILGGLLWTTGIGLSFFDDNVKVQFNVSQAPPGRFQGVAVGGKIIANIWNMNLRHWFGNDWEWWTTSIALGAHFSYFMMGPGENAQWMGQFLGQWEIIKADMSHFIPAWRFFRSISLYVEPGVWFAPSDVDNDPLGAAWRTLFTVGFGLRFSLF